MVDRVDQMDTRHFNSNDSALLPFWIPAGSERDLTRVLLAEAAPSIGAPITLFSRSRGIIPSPRFTISFAASNDSFGFLDPRLRTTSWSEFS